MGSISNIPDNETKIKEKAEQGLKTIAKERVVKTIIGESKASKRLRKGKDNLKETFDLLGTNSRALILQFAGFRGPYQYKVSRNNGDEVVSADNSDSIVTTASEISSTITAGAGETAGAGAILGDSARGSTLASNTEGKSRKLYKH